jgi:hypothetical protein
MSDYEPTIKIRRPPKIRTDGQGRSVWADPIEAADELELVSTQALRVILESNDVKARKAIETAASGVNEGVLARDPAAGTFEIIDDAELQDILDNTKDLPPIKRPADVTLVPLQQDSGEELSLVSTQALRKLLGTKSPASEKISRKKTAGTSGSAGEPGGGFDPYNRS